MEKTINIWLDLIDALDNARKQDVTLIAFKKRLLEIKFSKENKDYGGMVKVKLPLDLGGYFCKSENQGSNGR